MSGARAAAVSPALKPARSGSSSANEVTESTILVELNQRQQDNIIRAATSWQDAIYTMYSMRYELANLDRIYMREKDWTDEQVKSRIANRRGDSSKIQNVTVPIVMPQVNSALDYYNEVFLSGYPIFPIVADPQNETAALQMETIVNENATTAGWARELQMFFRDGLKYNMHAIECDWQQQTNWTVENDATKANSAGAKKVLWEGNVLKRMDLYNTFWDPRVHPAEMHSKGEFVGYTEIYSRVRFKAFCNSLYNKVPAPAVIKALASAPIQGAIGASTTAPFGYYIPYINPFPFYNKTASLDWLNWATNTPSKTIGVDYRNSYSVTKIYARIIPGDYDIDVPAKNTPQVWKFLIINGSVVLSAERLTNVHGFIPIFFGQPIEDGLDYQTKSFAANVSDLQEVASAMWNGYIASKRRLVSDRVLYDPSRITERDINSEHPAAKIPVRPSAYGKPLNEAVYQFPFRDQEADSLIAGSAAVINMANLVNGQNPATQGQFVKGNKTRHEYEDVMGHGNGQNRSMCLSTENQVLIPMKEVIKLNVLQYQQAKTVYNTGKGKSVNVDPVDLRKSAVHFKVADGFIPTDKLASDDLLQTALQQIGTSPQIASGFDLPGAFTYLMQTQGLDLTPFRKSPAQLQYEQAMAAWQQAAANAAKTGAAFNSPQPQPSQQLQQEIQQKQQQQSNSAPQLDAALESTQQ